MGKYAQEAEELLGLVGGKSNIAAVSHCVTRMRFVLNDPSKADIKKIEEDIRTRDFQDMNRSIAPLKQAEDAVVIDSSRLSIPEVMDRIVDAFQESLKLKG